MSFTGLKITLYYLMAAIASGRQSNCIAAAFNHFKNCQIMNTQKFIELLADVTNYDNVSFPVLRLRSDLTTAEIIYPRLNKNGEPADVSNQLIQVFQEHYNYSGNDSKMKILYWIRPGNDGNIKIDVKLMN